MKPASTGFYPTLMKSCAGPALSDQALAHRFMIAARRASEMLLYFLGLHFAQR
jgi:hypothetical protein